MLVSAVQQSESAIRIPIFPYPHPLASPSHPPYPTPLGGHKAPSWSPCAMRLLPTSYLFYIWLCMYVSATLSLRPSLPFRSCVLKLVQKPFLLGWSFLLISLSAASIQSEYWLLATEKGQDLSKAAFYSLPPLSSCVHPFYSYETTTSNECLPLPETLLGVSCTIFLEPHSHLKMALSCLFIDRKGTLREVN